MKLLPCPNCAFKNQTTQELIGESVVELTDCKKCGKRCGRVYKENSSASSASSWGLSQANKDRDEHKGDILQPFVGVDDKTGGGVINPAFVKVHGTKTLQKNMKVSREQVYGNLDKYGNG